MGSVWRATDLELRRVVAVKRATNGDGDVIRREARAGASLQHPHVITVFDVVTEEGERWLVMEYLPSRSLAQVVREDGKLPPEQAARVGAQVADALRAMHAQGVVHRDITPGNVLVGDDGTVKLADLGVAVWADATQTGEHHVAGTPGYTAPEVVSGHVATPAADIYSLGATLMDAVEPDGPLAAVLASLTDQKPARRPTAELAHAALVDRTPMRGRRVRRGVLVTTGILALAAAVAVAVTLWPSVPPGPEIIGDAHTADPCPFLRASDFDRFGPHRLDPDYGDFNQCRLDINVPGRGHAQVVLLLMDGPDGGSGDFPLPAKPGKIDIDRPGHEFGNCHRVVRMPQRYRVMIVAGYPKLPAIDACDIAEAPVGTVVDRLESRQVPRRATAFPSGSLARVDACALLGTEDLPRQLREATALPGFAHWECTWSVHGGLVRAVVLLHRRERLKPEPEEVIPVTLDDGREAFVLPNEWREDKCLVEIPFRLYTSDDGSERAEYAAVVVRDSQTSEQRCAVATQLATAISRALPR